MIIYNLVLLNNINNMNAMNALSNVENMDPMLFVYALIIFGVIELYRMFKER